MTKHMISIALLALLVVAPAMAQIPNFGKVLDPFQAGEISAVAVQSTSAPPAQLTAMSQNGVVPLTVNDVIRLALANNININIQRLAPLRSEYSLISSYARFEPSLSLSGTVSHSTSVSTRTIETGTDRNINLSGNYSASLDQTLKTGGNYSVGVNLSRRSSNDAFSRFNPTWNTNLTYSFNQPLLRGFGTRINTAPIVIARNNLEMSQIQFEQQVMNLVLQATNAYWDLVNARENLNVQQASLGLAERTHNDNLRQIEIGTLAPIDASQSESQVAQLREQIITTQYNVTRAEDAIKNLVTTVPDPALVLLALEPVETIQDVSYEILPVDEAIRLALVQRPEMRVLALEAENNALNLMTAKNNLRPQLNLSIRYGQTGTGGTERIFSGGFGGDQQLLALIEGGLANAFQDAFGFDNTNYSIGLNLNIPLGNKSAQAQYAQAVIQERNATSSRALTEQQIATEVRDSWRQIQTAQERIATATISTRLAEQTLQAEERKNQLGASQLRFVLQEQRNVTQARTSELAARIDYARAVATYNRAIGRTLELNNIRIDPEFQPVIAERE